MSRIGFQSQQKNAAFHTHSVFLQPDKKLLLARIEQILKDPFSGSVVARDVVSTAVLYKARKILKSEAFAELSTKTVHYFNEHVNPQTLNRLFLIAVNGSTVKMTNSPEFIEHFGTWNARMRGPLPMDRISQLFDPLNGITHQALIAPKKA